MSIQSEINRLKQAVSDAFTAIGNKGGTVPSSKVSGNLATAIQSIPSGVTVQTKTGTFTSASNKTGTTVNCGFKPDFVTITEKLTYDENSNFNTTISLDSSFNFIDCTDNTGNLESVSFTIIQGTDYPYDLFVRRTDNGFMVSIWKMTADMTSGAWWGNKTFTYYAYKIT